MLKSKKDQGVQVISVIYTALKDNRPSVANYILLTEKEMTAHIQQDTIRYETHGTDN